MAGASGPVARRERERIRLARMKLATSRTAPALRWFVVAWFVFTALTLWRVSRALPVVEASIPRSHDLLGSGVASNASEVVPCGENERWIELAWVQLLPTGIEEALFGVAQVRLQLDRSKELDFMVPAEAANRLEVPAPNDGPGGGAPHYNFFDSLDRVVEVCWRGSKDGVAALDVVSNDRGRHDAVDMKFDGGRGLASVGTLLFAEDDLAVVPELRTGSVLLVRVTRTPSTTAELVKFDTWRERARELAPKLATATAFPSVSVQKRGDRADRNSPLLPIDPLASAATASLVFRDPELAAAVRGCPRSLPDDTTINSDLARGDEAALVALARGETGDVARFLDHKLELGVRGMLVQDDPTVAARISAALADDVRNSINATWVVGLLDFEPPAPAAAAWRSLRHSAAAHFGAPWNVLFRWKYGMFLIGLLPLATALLVVFVRRARAGELPEISIWALVALALTQWLALEHKDYAWPFALLFVGLAWRRLAVPIGAFERTLLALALVGVTAVGWRSIGWMVDEPRADAYCRLSFSMAWSLVARWLHDGTDERVPLRLQAFLALHLLAMILLGPAFGRAWSSLDWPAPAALLLIVAAALLALYVARLRGQRRGLRAGSKNPASLA